MNTLLHLLDYMFSEKNSKKNTDNQYPRPICHITSLGFKKFVRFRATALTERICMERSGIFNPMLSEVPYYFFIKFTNI